MKDKSKSILRKIYEWLTEKEPRMLPWFVSIFVFIYTYHLFSKLIEQPVTALDIIKYLLPIIVFAVLFFVINIFKNISLIKKSRKRVMLFLFSEEDAHYKTVQLFHEIDYVSDRLFFFSILERLVWHKWRKELDEIIEKHMEENNLSFKDFSYLEYCKELSRENV